MSLLWLIVTGTAQAGERPKVVLLRYVLINAALLSFNSTTSSRCTLPFAAQIIINCQALQIILSTSQPALHKRHASPQSSDDERYVVISLNGRTLQLVSSRRVALSYLQRIIMVVKCIRKFSVWCRWWTALIYWPVHAAVVSTTYLMLQPTTEWDRGRAGRRDIVKHMTHAIRIITGSLQNGRCVHNV